MDELRDLRVRSTPPCSDWSIMKGLTYITYIVYMIDISYVMPAANQSHCASTMCIHVHTLQYAFRKNWQHKILLKF